MFMSCIFVRYPAFVGAFYLGSRLKSCCSFGHQQFLYELCLPVKMRSGTSTMSGRKTLWLLLSGSCISLNVCVRVSVRPMRQRGSYPRHHVGLRFTASKKAVNENVRRQTWAIVLLAGSAQENIVHDPIKVFWHIYREAAYRESDEVFITFRFREQKVLSLQMSPN